MHVMAENNEQNHNEHNPASESLNDYANRLARELADRDKSIKALKEEFAETAGDNQQTAELIRKRIDEEVMPYVVTKLKDLVMHATSEATSAKLIVYLLDLKLGLTKGKGLASVNEELNELIESLK